MLGRDYQGQNCSIARTLELIGERWTLLILRDVFRGRRRFDELQTNLGIASNVLSKRLERLVEVGILERVRYQARPARYEYRLTTKGRELGTALVALLHWGDRYLAPDGPPVVLHHDGCGGPVTTRVICEECGAAPEPEALKHSPGPGHREPALV